MNSAEGFTAAENAALYAFSRVVDGESLRRSVGLSVAGSWAVPPVTFLPVVEALVMLACQPGAGSLEFVRAWRGALLAGAPPDLIASATTAWLAGCAEQLRPGNRTAGDCEFDMLCALGKRAAWISGQANAVLSQALLDGQLEVLPEARALERIAALLDGAGSSQMALITLRLPDQNLSYGTTDREAWYREAMQQVSAKLRAVDRLFVLSASEWLLCLPALSSSVQVPLAAQALIQACGKVLQKYFGVEEGALHCGAALHPRDAVTAAGLLRHARRGCERAKETGQSFFSETGFNPVENSIDDEELAVEFARALHANALMLHFQPQVCLVDRTSRACEALLRWRNSAGDWVAPQHMLVFAERLGLLPKLCNWLIAEASRTLLALDRAGMHVRLAINLTASDLYDEELPVLLQQHARTWNVDPARLSFEVTETMLIADPARARRVLQSLRELGCHVSLDDFGTGFSSLAYLRDFPVDEIKIDRSFVHEAAASARDAAIVRSIIALGRGLGVNVVAEGAETDETVTWLEAQGCPVVQGYAFARPMPLEDLLSWLSRSA